MRRTVGGTPGVKRAGNQRAADQRGCEDCAAAITKSGEQKYLFFLLNAEKLLKFRTKIGLTLKKRYAGTVPVCVHPESIKRIVSWRYVCTFVHAHVWYILTNGTRQGQMKGSMFAFSRSTGAKTVS